MTASFARYHQKAPYRDLPRKGIPVEERDYTLEELKNADEIIVSSSGALCMPACELDGEPVGGKAPEIIKTLQDAYLKRLHDECGE